MHIILSSAGRLRRKTMRLGQDLFDHELGLSTDFMNVQHLTGTARPHMTPDLPNRIESLHGQLRTAKG